MCACAGTRDCAAPLGGYLTATPREDSTGDLGKVPFTTRQTSVRNLLPLLPRATCRCSGPRCRLPSTPGTATGMPSRELARNARATRAASFPLARFTRMTSCGRLYWSATLERLVPLAPRHGHSNRCMKSYRHRRRCPLPLLDYTRISTPLPSHRAPFGRSARVKATRDAADAHRASRWPHTISYFSYYSTSELRVSRSAVATLPSADYLSCICRCSCRCYHMTSVPAAPFLPHCGCRLPMRPRRIEQTTLAAAVCEPHGRAGEPATRAGG